MDQAPFLSIVKKSVAALAKLRGAAMGLEAAKAFVIEHSLRG